MVRMDKARSRGSILLNTVCEVVADIMILDPRNCLLYTSDAADE